VLVDIMTFTIALVSWLLLLLGVGFGGVRVLIVGHMEQPCTSLRVPSFSTMIQNVRYLEFALGRHFFIHFLSGKELS
jgi:hypothetical protein